jgi:hypothetical protein
MPEQSQKLESQAITDEIEGLEEAAKICCNFLPNVRSIEEAIGITTMAHADFMRAADRVSELRMAGPSPELYDALRRFASILIYTAACVRNNPSL